MTDVYFEGYGRWCCFNSPFYIKDELIELYGVFKLHRRSEMNFRYTGELTASILYPNLRHKDRAKFPCEYPSYSDTPQFENLPKLGDFYTMAMFGRLVFIIDNSRKSLLKLVQPDEINMIVDKSNGSTQDLKVKTHITRQDTRKFKTQNMYADWHKAYVKLKRDNPSKSNVWISKQIAKMDIAKACKSETIRKNMVLKK